MGKEQVLVLTVTGSDRAGLVEAISKVVSDHGANWEASHMARIGGRFAGILQVAIAQSKVNSLRSALDDLVQLGLSITVEADQDTEQDRGDSYWIELVGSDQPNIVHDISAVLASREVEVLELNSELCAAPVSGGLLFKMQASLRCPAGLSRGELRACLEDLANSLMVDLTLND